MTHEEFTAAVAGGRKVRLRDRTRCFYVDEWYEPIILDNGDPAIYTHTGKTIEANDDLLAQLTTEPAIMTIGRLKELLDEYTDDTPVVLRGGQAAYGDITPESIGPVLLRRNTGAAARQQRYKLAGIDEVNAAGIETIGALCIGDDSA